MRETDINGRIFLKHKALERIYHVNATHIYKEKEHKNRDVASQCDKRDKLNTYRNVSTLRKRKRENRYYASNELHTYHARARSYTEVGIGSVRTLLKRRVQKIHLPEAIEKGCGSSDLISVVNGRTKYHNAKSFYESKSVSSKCVGGVIENDICDVLSEKLSPIIKKVSESTSPKQSENRNMQIGSYSINKNTANMTTQVEEKIDEQVEVHSFQLEKKQDRKKESPEHKDQIQITTYSKHVQDKNTVIVLNCKEPQEVSSESLLQYIHDLEYASDTKNQDKSSEYESEPKKSTCKESKAKDEANGDGPRTYIQAGLNKSESQRTEAKSSSYAHSYSNRPSILDSDIHNSLPTYHSSKFKKDDTFSKSDVHEKKPVFKIWSKRFEDILQATLKPSFKRTYEKKDIAPNQSKTEKVEEKEKRNFFFFKKKHRDKEKEKMIRKKKSVTTEFCEVKDGLKIVMGRSLDAEKSKTKLFDQADTTAWVQNFLSHAIESCDSLKVRWNNSMFNSSSSTAFELRNNPQKYSDTDIFDSKSMMNIHSSCYQHFCSRQQDISYVRDVEAWMIPNTIVNYPNMYTTQKIKRNNDNMEVRISDQKWIIDKSKAFSHKIEVILFAKNIVECNKKESCLRIDIPNGFFPDSSDTSIEYSNKRRGHSSDEEVYNVVEYETGSDFEKETKICNKGQQILNNIEVTVSFKSKNQMQSRLLETMIKTPTVHRDVIIQGSTVCIPAVRDDIVGVSIVAENDLLQKDEWNPVLKNEDCFSGDDSNVDKPRHKTCKFGESFLQEYYRNWAGLDLWCVNDCHLLCCSETSKTSCTNPGIITKSCPNILDDFLVETSYATANGPDCNRKLSHTSSCLNRRDSLSSITSLCKCKNKVLYSYPKKEQMEIKRVLPKDSIEVYKRRKIYAMSMKSQWKCSECDVPACSVASTQSRGTSPKCWSLKDCNDHTRPGYNRLTREDDERKHICLLEKNYAKNKSYNMESTRKTYRSRSVQDVSTSCTSLRECLDRDVNAPTENKKLAQSVTTSPAPNSDINLRSNFLNVTDFPICKSSSDSNTLQMKRKSNQYSPCCKDDIFYKSQQNDQVQLRLSPARECPTPTTACPLCGSTDNSKCKESLHASLTKISRKSNSIINTPRKRNLDNKCICRPTCPYNKDPKKISSHKYYSECPATPPSPLGFKTYIECPATPPSPLRFRCSSECPPTPPSPISSKTYFNCPATPPSPSKYEDFPECPPTPPLPLNSRCPLNPNMSTFAPYLISSGETSPIAPIFKITKSRILPDGSEDSNLRIHNKSITPPRHPVTKILSPDIKSHKKSRKAKKTGSPPSSEPKRNKYTPPCSKHHKFSSTDQSFPKDPPKCTSPNAACVHIPPCFPKPSKHRKCISPSQNCPHVPPCFPVPSPKSRNSTTSYELRSPSLICPNSPPHYAKIIENKNCSSPSYTCSHHPPCFLPPLPMSQKYSPPSQISPQSSPCFIKLSSKKPQEYNSPSEDVPLASNPEYRNSISPTKIRARSQSCSPKLCSKPQRCRSPLQSCPQNSTLSKRPKPQKCSSPSENCPHVPPCCPLPSSMLRKSISPSQTYARSPPDSPKLYESRKYSLTSKNGDNVSGPYLQQPLPKPQKCTSPSQNCPHVPPCDLKRSKPRKVPRVLPYNTNSLRSRNSGSRSPSPTPRKCTSSSQISQHSPSYSPTISPNPKKSSSPKDICPHSHPCSPTICPNPKKCNCPTDIGPHSPSKSIHRESPSPKTCDSATDISSHSPPCSPKLYPKPKKFSSPSQNRPHSPPCFPKICLSPKKSSSTTDTSQSPPYSPTKSPKLQKSSSPSQNCPYSPPCLLKLCPKPKNSSSPPHISRQSSQSSLPTYTIPRKCSSPKNLCPHNPPCFPKKSPKPRKCRSPSQNCPHVPPCFKSQRPKKPLPDDEKPHSPPNRKSVSSSKVNSVSSPKQILKLKKKSAPSQDSSKPCLKLPKISPLASNDCLNTSPNNQRTCRRLHKTSKASLNSKPQCPTLGLEPPSNEVIPFSIRRCISPTQNRPQSYPTQLQSSKCILPSKNRQPKPSPPSPRKCTSLCLNCPHNPPCHLSPPSSPSQQKKQKSNHRNSPSICTSPTEICQHSSPCFRSLRPSSRKCTSPSQDCSHTPPCFPPLNPRGKECTSPSQDCSHTPPCFPPLNPRSKKCTSSYKLCSHSPPCFPLPCKLTKCTSPSQICIHSPPCYPALGFTLQKCVSPLQNCPRVPLCASEQCPKQALSKQSSSKPNSKPRKCTSPSQVCSHIPSCFPSPCSQLRKRISPYQLCQDIPERLSRPSLNKLGNSKSQNNNFNNYSPPAQKVPSKDQNLQNCNKSPNYTTPSPPQKISQETSKPPAPIPSVQTTSTPSLKSFFPFHRNRSKGSKKSYWPSIKRSRSGLSGSKHKNHNRNKQCSSEQYTPQITTCQCPTTNSLHRSMNTPLVVEQHSIYDRHYENSLTPSVMRLLTPCRCCTKDGASSWALKVNDSGSSSMSVYYAHSTDRTEQKPHYEKNYNTYAKLRCNCSPKKICPNDSKTVLRDDEPPECPPYLPASRSGQTSGDKNLTHTEIHLKISPLAKKILESSSHDETPEHWQQQKTDPILSLNTHDQVTIELSKDVAVMREELGIKVKDVNGHMLYERKVYEVAPNKPADMPTSNIVGDVYRHSEFQKVNTPLSVQSHSDKHISNDKHNINETNSLEIHFIIKLLQGNKSVDYTMHTGDDLNTKQIQERPQDVLVLSNKGICSSYKADDKDDINIYITIKNWKAHEKSKDRKSNSYDSELSSKNLSKLKSDSLQYSQIKTENVNKISSEFRATIDLSSSLDNSKVRMEKQAGVDTSNVQEQTKYDNNIYTVKSTELASNLQVSKDNKECHIMKSKSRMTKLRDMLKLMLTSSMNKSERTRIQTIPSDELEKHVTYASFKPNYFRHCRSIYSNYKFESNLTLSDTQINKKVTYPVANSDSEESDDERFKLLQIYNTGHSSNHKLSKDKNDQVLTCDYSFKDTVDDKTQKCRHLTSKVTRPNISISQFPVDDQEAVKPKTQQKHRKHTTKLPKSRANQMREHHNMDKNTDSPININEDDKTVKLISLYHDLDHDTNNEIKKIEENNVLEMSDILQSYETKKAVLEIYAEKDVSSDGKGLVAKLPKFEFDAENDIYNAITNSYICQNTIMINR